MGKRRFGNECMTAQGFKGSARRIGSDLEITRKDPHLAVMLDAYLRRSQHVARRMQRNLDSFEVEDLTVLNRSNRGRWGQPRSQHMLTAGHREILTRSGARVIRVSMRDDRRCDGLTGIDEEFPRFTE